MMNNSIFSTINTFKIRNLNGMILIIEGNISSGKTTLGKRIEKYFNLEGYNCKFFEEYRNKDLLDQYICDMKKYAYSFQIFMLNRRIQTYREAIEHTKLGGISVIDRSIMGDWTFCKFQVKKGNITKDEFNVYESIIKSENIITPHFILYLDCDLERCMNRIKQRNITSEIKGYNIDYLNDLSNEYENTIKNYISPYHTIIRIDNNKENSIEYIIECINKNILPH